MQEDPLLTTSGLGATWDYTIGKMTITYPSSEAAASATVRISAGYARPIPTGGSGVVESLKDPVFTYTGPTQEGATFTYTDVGGRLGGSQMYVYNYGIWIEFTVGGQKYLVEAMSASTLNLYLKTIPV